MVEKKINLINPKEAFKILENVIVGSEKAKKDLASITFENIYSFLHPETADNYFHPNQVLFLGKDGTGKDLILKTLAEIYDIPFVKLNLYDLEPKISFSQFMINNIFNGLVESDTDSKNSGVLKPVKNSAQSIVYIQGIDLIVDNDYYSSYGNVDFISKKILQTEITNFINDRINIFSDSISEPIPTKNMLYVFGGNFIKLEDIIAKRLVGRGLSGFKQANRYPLMGNLDEENIFKYVLKEDFIEFGFDENLLRSFSTLTYTNSLSQTDFVRLLQSKSSYLNTKIELLNNLGVEVKVKPSGIVALSELLYQQGSDIGGVKHLVDTTLNESYFADGQIIFDDSFVKKTI